MSDQGPPSPSRDESEQSLSRWPRWSSDLHESLASQEASASELRQELDDLRRTLDAPPAGEPGRRPVAPAGEPGRHRRPPRRRVLTASAAAVVVLGVIGVGLATRGTDPRTAPAAAAASSASATSSPSSTPGAVPGTSLPAVAPLPPWPGQTGPEPQGLPAHGLGVDL